MRKSMVTRLLSCFLAGLLLMETPLQVKASSEDNLAENGNVSAMENLEETDDLENSEKSDYLEESDEKENLGNFPEQDDPDVPAESYNAEKPESLGELEDQKEPEDQEESDKQEETEASDNVDGAAISAEEQFEEKTENMTLEAFQYGVFPEYSEGFYADEIKEVLSDIAVLLQNEDAVDVSSYNLKPEVLKDILSWLVNNDEAYYTVLPYVEYTYIEKDNFKEVQKVKISRIDKTKILSLNQTRNQEEIEFSYASVDGIEEYQLFKISADSVEKISYDEEKGGFVDRAVLDDTSIYQYILCGYIVTENTKKLYAFSAPVCSECELLPPENLEVVPGEESLTVKWDGDPMASGYEVEVSTEQNGEFIFAGKTEETEYTQNELETGETYYYRVRAYSQNEDREIFSDYTDAEGAMVLASDSAEFPLEYTIENKTAILKWKQVPGADRYIVYKIENGKRVQAGDPLNDSVGASFTYGVSGLTYNDVGIYQVVAYEVAGGAENELAVSKKVRIEVTFADLDLQGSATGFNQIKLTWSESDWVDGYTVERWNDVLNTWEEQEKVSKTTTSWTDTDVKLGVEYRYQVKPYQNQGSGNSEGAPSNEVKVKTSLGTSKISSVIATDYRTLKISWSPVKGATGYELYRLADKTDTDGTKIASGNFTSYSDMHGEPGVIRYYKVRPYYKGKASDNKLFFGSYSEAEGKATALERVSNAKAVSESYNSIKLTWGRVAGANGYEIKRSESASTGFKVIGTVGSGNTLSYTSEKLSFNKVYYYRICAYYQKSDGKKEYGKDYLVSAKTILPSSKITSVSGVNYNTVKITWDKVTGASGYKVYRSTSARGTYTTVATIKSGGAVTCQNTNLTLNKTYYYKVRPYRIVDGKEIYGSYSSIARGTPKMGTVTKLNAVSVSYNSAKISWTKVAGASGYEVYYSTSKNSGYKRLKTVVGNNYTHTGLITGKDYYYKILAYRTVSGKKVYGEYSTITNVKPIPATVVAKRSAVTYNSVKLAWKKVEGANGYDIYRSESQNGIYSRVTVVTSANTLSYTNTGLVTGKSYYYKVRAFRTTGGKKVYGAFSASVGAKTVLSAVTNLKAVPTGDEKSGSIKLTWSKVAGASGYKIMRATSKTGTYKVVETIASGSTLSFTNTGLAYGQNYYYKVYATRGSYTSAVAGPVSAMVIAMSLSDSSLSLTVGQSQKVAVATVPKVTVSWSTSDKKVATVDNSGKITAVGAGTAKIYVKANGLTKSISVTVKGKYAGAYKGIDVSAYQGTINWKKVADSGIDFAMIRVITGSSSSTTRDTRFKENYDGARDNGIKVGLYRYSYATSRTKARNEANAIIDTLNGRKLDYPIVMDMEDSSILSGTDSNARRSEIILAFKEVIEDAGYEFALYANTTWLNDYLDMNMLKDVDIWVARWRDLDKGHGYNGKGNVTMWQYSSEGNVPGISGKVDLNVSYKNY